MIEVGDRIYVRRGRSMGYPNDNYKHELELIVIGLLYSGVDPSTPTGVRAVVDRIIQQSVGENAQVEWRTKGDIEIVPYLYCRDLGTCTLEEMLTHPSEEVREAGSHLQRRRYVS